MSPDADNKKQSFCWIRILNVLDDATVPPEKKWVVQDGPERHGGRPPGRIASDTTIRRQGPAACWQADPDYFGRAAADTVFDYGPVFDKREDAVEWLVTTPSGIQWDREASNRFLIGVDWEKPVKPACSLCEPSETDPDRFPLDAWSDLECTRHKPSGKHSEKPLFDPVKVQWPPAGEPTEANECDKVGVPSPTEPEMALIRRQAHGLGQALQPVLDVIGIDPDDPKHVAWKDLIAQAAVPAEAAIFLEKRRHGRKRPWQACQNPKVPMFSQTHDVPGGTQPHLLYPGHPSYPSGHAAMVYLWAELIASLRPNLKNSLMGAAYQVSNNRVIAGLHYPSDVEGGRQLAVAMVDQIQRKDTPEKKLFLETLASLLK
jgi:acid phosphatase (class A)